MTRRKLFSGLTALTLLPLATHGLHLFAAPTAGRKLPAPSAAPIRLHLDAVRRQTVRDAQGREQEAWQALADSARVQPGDTLRYTLSVEDAGPRPIPNLVLTQPVPARAVYVPGSAVVAGAEGVRVSFRVDGEAGYSEAPTVAVPQPDGTTARQPAPAEAYRSLRWTFSQPLAPGQVAQAFYVEKVR